MYSESITDPSTFWSAIASEFHWKEPWDPANIVQGNFDTTKGPISTSFFSGAKTNIAWNCLDEQISKGRGDIMVYHKYLESILPKLISQIGPDTKVGV